MTDIPFTNTIEFSELSDWSPWPARLLGDEEWSTPPRTTEKIEREYNTEKYGAALEYLEGHPTASPQELRTFEFGGDLEKEICVSCGDTLYRTTLAKAWEYQNEQVLALMMPWLESADIVCELGSGFGYYLWYLQQRFPDKRYVGGDFASNALLVGEKLFADHTPITIEQLDLTAEDYHLPFTAKNNEKVVLFTFYAFDNLPTAKSSLERLKAIKGDNCVVCNFEPIFEWCSDSPLGELRKVYTVKNDYNRDLLTVIEGSSDMYIEATEKDFFGFNPLHPTSLVTWR